MSGLSSRNKGKRGEREAAAKLEELGLASRPRRGVQYQGGPDSPDVVDDDGHFHWEVKRAERLSLYDALEQAESDLARLAPDLPTRPLARKPVVLHKKNGKPWVFIAYLDDMPDVVFNLGDVLGWIDV